MFQRFQIRLRRLLSALSRAKSLLLPVAKLRGMFEGSGCHGQREVRPSFFTSASSVFPPINTMRCYQLSWSVLDEKFLTEIGFRSTFISTYSTEKSIRGHAFDRKVYGTLTKARHLSSFVCTGNCKVSVRAFDFNIEYRRAPRFVGAVVSTSIPQKFHDPPTFPSGKDSGSRESSGAIRILHRIERLSRYGTRTSSGGVAAMRAQRRLTTTDRFHWNSDRTSRLQNVLQRHLSITHRWI